MCVCVGKAPSEQNTCFMNPKFPEQKRRRKSDFPFQSSTILLFDGGFSSLFFPFHPPVHVDGSGLGSIRKLAVCHNIICNVDTDYDFP